MKKNQSQDRQQKYQCNNSIFPNTKTIKSKSICSHYCWTSLLGVLSAAWPAKKLRKNTLLLPKMFVVKGDQTSSHVRA